MISSILKSKLTVYNFGVTAILKKILLACNIIDLFPLHTKQTNIFKIIYFYSLTSSSYRNKLELLCLYIL